MRQQICWQQIWQLEKKWREKKNEFEKWLENKEKYVQK